MGLNVLFFQHPGTCSRDIFADIIDGYREAGHNVFVIELAPIWDNLDTFPAPELKKEFAGRVSEQVLAVAATHKIDLCVCMWGNAPATLGGDGTQNFFDANKLPILMHWQDDSGLNLKPFEITLSGTCLLQAHRVGVEDHFDSTEAVVFHTPHECRRRAAGMLLDPDRITRMAEAGRARSLRQHCWRHRATAVGRMMAGRAGLRASGTALRSKLTLDAR